MGFLDRLKAVLTPSDTGRRAPAEAVDPGVESTPEGERGQPDEERTHTVVRGDTLAAIAERHGVDAAAVAELNGLDNPDLIYPGQVFRLPRR